LIPSFTSSFQLDLFATFLIGQLLSVNQLPCGNFSTNCIFRHVVDICELVPFLEYVVVAIAMEVFVYQQLSSAAFFLSVP